MSHESRTDPLSPESLPMPSPDLRERVLNRCRQEMSERRQADRFRRSRWRWSLAGGVACLLLLNGMEERQIDARIAGITRDSTSILVATRASHGQGRLLLTRATLLAALLRDPDSL